MIQIPTLSDNFTYLLTWDDKALLIDPAEKIQTNHEIIAILVTHHHHDHTAGISHYDVPVIGPDDDRIPHITQRVHDKEVLTFGTYEIHIIETPGHTIPAVCYYEPNKKLLFTGDTLFGAGCGRLFEGSAEMLYNSLQKLCALPDDTQILAGHNYTEKNVRFAQTIDPTITRKAHPISTLGEEKKTNPFLGVDLETFIQRRKARDNF